MIAQQLSRFGGCCCLGKIQKQTANKIGSVMPNATAGLMKDVKGVTEEMKDQMDGLPAFQGAINHKKYGERGPQGQGEVTRIVEGSSTENMVDKEKDEEEVKEGAEEVKEKIPEKEPPKLLGDPNCPEMAAALMGLKYLGVEAKVTEYVKGEKESDVFLKKNPQGTLPFMEDDGFYICECTAILQYLGEAYKRDETFYPAEPKQRAMVNHKLAFYISTYKPTVSTYQELTIEKRLDNLEFLQNMLEVFDDILTLQSSPYVAGDNVTIADLPLLMSTVALESMSVNLIPFPKLQAWYDNFKIKQPGLWEVAKICLEHLKSKEKPIGSVVYQ